MRGKGDSFFFVRHLGGGARVPQLLIWHTGSKSRTQRESPRRLPWWRRKEEFPVCCFASGIDRSILLWWNPCLFCILHHSGNQNWVRSSAYVEILRWVRFPNQSSRELLKDWACWKLNKISATYPFYLWSFAFASDLGVAEDVEMASDWQTGSAHSYLRISEIDSGLFHFQIRHKVAQHLHVSESGWIFSSRTGWQIFTRFRTN